MIDVCGGTCVNVDVHCEMHLDILYLLRGHLTVWRHLQASGVLCLEVGSVLGTPLVMFEHHIGVGSSCRCLSFGCYRVGLPYCNECNRVTQ